MYLALECTTMSKFGLNKSGYLISIAKDQYFYWIVSLQIMGGGGGKAPPAPSPSSNPPFLEQLPLSHSFTPFLKISSQPPLPFQPLAKIFNPHFQKGGGGRGCGLWKTTTKKIPGTNNSLKHSALETYWQPILKFWSIPIMVGNHSL